MFSFREDAGGRAALGCVCHLVIGSFGEERRRGKCTLGGPLVIGDLSGRQFSMPPKFVLIGVMRGRDANGILPVAFIDPQRDWTPLRSSHGCN